MTLSGSQKVSKLALQELHSDAELTVVRGTLDTLRTGPLVIVFCSKTKLEGSLEFAGSVAQAGRDALFFIDHQRVWFASPGTVALVIKYVQQELEFRKCDCADTIGFSMGAFAAIAFAERLPIRNALAFGPRFSTELHSEIDMVNAKALLDLGEKVALKSLAPALKKLTFGTIIHGTAGEDLPRIRRFSVPENVDHWLMLGVNHHVAAWFQSRSFLAPLVAAVLNGDRNQTCQILRDCGAKRPSSLAARTYLAEFRGMNAVLRLQRRIFDHLKEYVWRRDTANALRKS